MRGSRNRHLCEFLRHRSRGFRGRFCRNLRRDFRRNLRRDFRRNLRRNFCRNLRRDFRRNLRRDFCRDLGRDLGRDLRRDFRRDFRRDLFRNLRRNFGGFFRHFRLRRGFRRCFLQHRLERLDGRRDLRRIAAVDGCNHNRKDDCHNKQAEGNPTSDVFPFHGTLHSSV